MNNYYQYLLNGLRIRELLSKRTSWKVGGYAQQLYRPISMRDLTLFLSLLPKTEPILWLGLGSNILIRDGGFAGTVISIAGTLQQLDVDDGVVTAEAGVYCGKLAKWVAKSSLTGAAFLVGIPGTLGGALAMNAGAYQSEIWQFVLNVTTVDRHGTLRINTPEKFRVSYRNVEFPDGEWFISVRLKFDEGDTNFEQNLIKNFLKLRNITQPINKFCAGSVFRNPKGDFAGRLIEVAKLKGLTIGGASVSHKHANFIVNNRTATAFDIESLILLVQQTVESTQGVHLVPEVRVVGEY
ncbi:MAG: UDP-N-acetylmuramate dehydrogenase [Piscirickettsiaceae bacterium]|nr:UDP-N-acetylmuramate dehydrogenase [Piscirickettsiaceae bacterium]